MQMNSGRIVKSKQRHHHAGISIINNLLDQVDLNTLTSNVLYFDVFYAL